LSSTGRGTPGRRRTGRRPSRWSPGVRATAAALANITVASIVAIFGVAEIPRPWLFAGTFGLTVGGYLAVEAFLSASLRRRAVLLAWCAAVGFLLVGGVGVYHALDRPDPPARPTGVISDQGGPLSATGAELGGSAAHLPRGATLWLLETDDLGEYWALAPVDVAPDGTWKVRDVDFLAHASASVEVTLVYAGNATEERILSENYSEEFLGLPRNRVADRILTSRNFDLA
jgi:hypothetical protein